MTVKQIQFLYSTRLGKLEVNFPKPARENLPADYKKMAAFTSPNKNLLGGQLNQTVKRCMPFLDAMTSGYIVKTPADLFVTLQDGIPFVQWGTEEAILETHELKQIPQSLVPNFCYGVPFKMINNFVIKTPKGYSTLFVPILNDPNGAIYASAGVVETDVFDALIHFPFFIRKGFTGKIPAGTPVVQLIPFQRHGWKASYAVADFEKMNQTVLLIRRQFEFAYKKLFWQRKRYE